MTDAVTTASALTVRQALRAGTAATHQALDQLWDGKSLGHREHYVRFLAASADALLPIEAGLARAGMAQLLPDWPLRQRSEAIAADLAGFGLAPPRTDPASIASRPAMLGTLYVLEGSRLGGALLLRQIQASDDCLIHANHRYLAHGQGGGLWRSFLAGLDRADPNRAELDLMIEAARDAFGRFDTAARAALA